MGKRRIKIELGEQYCIADLFFDKAPKTCAALWKLLPLKADTHHARICDHELIIPIRLTGLEKKENTAPPPGHEVGDVGWWFPRQCLNIWYGESIPLGTTSLIGKISENLEGFAKEARKVWYHPGVEMRILPMEE